jgi:hypothetical protein
MYSPTRVTSKLIHCRRVATLLTVGRRVPSGFHDEA